MKKKVMIVDDEPLIAAGLAEKIDWDSIDVEIVGTASNGEDGLRLIEEQLPDIVISDVRMPVYSGVQLAEICRERYPAVKFILLSAYSDFEYAQQAIRLQISDYVLKPVESEMLIEAVRRAIDSIREQERIRKHVSELELANQATRQFVSSFLLFEVAQKGAANDIRGMEQVLDDLLQKTGVVMFLNLYNIPRGSIESYRSLAAREFLMWMEKQGLDVYARREENGLAILCRMPEVEDLTVGCQMVQESASKAVAHIDWIFKQEGAEDTICVCVLAAPYTNVQELKDAYRLCMDRIQITELLCKSCAIRADELKSEVTWGVDTERVLHYLKNGNTEQMRHIMQTTCETISRNMDHETGMLFLKNLHRGAMGACALAGIMQPPMEQNRYERENFAKKVDELQKRLIEISNYIAQRNDLVGRIDQLIQEHYQESTFGLAEVARILGVSNSYLSRLYKKRTGENFVDRLLNVRMDHAKFLLETTRKSVAAIAEASGFAEGAYFAQVFKRYMGETPSQYRENWNA